MPVQNDIRKKANTYFFSKVVFNFLLIVLGAVFIAFFLRHMQRETALFEQRINSEQALTEAVWTLEENAQDAEELTRVFHDGNQAMLDDLRELMTSGLFDSLAQADQDTRIEITRYQTKTPLITYYLADIVCRKYGLLIQYR